MLGEMMERPFFVYGSLMKGFWNEEKYLKGKVIRREAGETNGKLYHIENKGFPALIEGSETVFGEVIWVKNFPEVVRELDEMESFSKSEEDRSQYLRVIQPVLLDNREIEAYIYRYNPKAELNRDDQLMPIPSGTWRKFMKK
ncbi:gamma-glutamylcyclotransferase [Gottschalkiaceae bacterium SANA]|nr:gamma-glutamylcyclotransferase [Gottschalkiaceae bacterium SANA]